MPTYSSGSDQGGGISAVTSLSWSHTMNSNSNNLLLTAIATKGGLATATATWNTTEDINTVTSEYSVGQDGDPSSDGSKVHVAGLTGATTGTQTIAWSFASTTVAGVAGDFYDVDQTTPAGTPIQTNAANTDTISITPTASSFCVDFVSFGSVAGVGISLTADGGQTEIGQNFGGKATPTPTILCVGSSYESSVSGTMGWTASQSVGSGAQIGLELNAPSASTTPPVAMYHYRQLRENA